MENQTKYLIFGYSRNSQKPLDPRNSISSLLNINTELPIHIRYGGLIFFVEDIQKLYTFENDLNSPVDLTLSLSNTQINGLIQTNYTNLLTELNNTNSSIGSLVTVFPLGITFVFDGTNWKYHSGEYKATDTQLNQINNSLKSIGKFIIQGNNKFIFKSDLTKSTEIIVLSPTNILPTTEIENNRYYLKGDIIYFGILNKLYKLGEGQLLIENFQLNIGDNNITHNLNSSYISALIWINNINAGINEIFNLQVKIIDNQSINIPANLQITGNLLIQSKY